MSNITLENILSIVRQNNGLSSTAISRLLGYSKNKPAVAEVLEELEDQGLVEVDSSGPFVKYFAADVEADEDDEDFEDDDDTSEEVSASDGLVEKTGSLSFVDANVRGYLVTKNEEGYSVKFPDSGRVHQIAENERILVINDDRRVVISAPEDALAEIKEYTSEHGFTQYIVKDVETGRALSPNNIDIRNVLIFVEVSRHNKAGI